MAKKKKADSPKNKEQLNLLKKMNRAELLELLIAQTRRADELEAQLQKANQELQRRDIVIRNAGSIAEAALGLNEVFEAADRAAQQYISNIRMMVDASELDLELPKSVSVKDRPDPVLSQTLSKAASSAAKQKNAPIAVEKLGTFVAGSSSAVSRTPSGSGVSQNRSGAADSAIPLDIADFITSGIGSSSPPAPKTARSGTKPATKPDRSGVKPATKTARTDVKPATKPAQHTQTMEFKGMQLGQLLQMASDDFFPESKLAVKSAASKPATPAASKVVHTAKPAAKQNPATAQAVKPKSTIPFKSSLAPANRQPAGQVTKESDFFDKNGEIDFSKIFEK